MTFHTQSFIIVHLVLCSLLCYVTCRSLSCLRNSKCRLIKNLCAPSKFCSKQCPMNHSATETPYPIFNTLRLCFPPDSPGQFVFARTLLCCVLIHSSIKCNCLTMQVNKKIESMSKLLCSFKVL